MKSQEFNIQFKFHLKEKNKKNLDFTVYKLIQLTIFHMVKEVNIAKPRLLICLLTHASLDKMAAIMQMTFSNTFSCKEIVLFRFKFNWNLFPSFQLIIFYHWFR